MPIREFYCENCREVEERYQKRPDAPVPTCHSCGAARTVLASRFGVVFTGPLARRYNDPKKEGYYQEGFWAYKKRSSVSGQPEATFIETWDQLRAFNRAEGLSAPGEVPNNASISADGRNISGVGMAGQWVGGMPEMPARLRELVEKPIEEFKPPGLTATPSMPIDHGISVSALDPAEVGCG